jgi:hypothetical protein
MPFVARVTAYALNTPSGKCTLTLDTALTSNPGSGVSVYAGGPAVLPVALAVLSYVDSVGPSRGSGAVGAAVAMSAAFKALEGVNKVGVVFSGGNVSLDKLCW